jgi:YycE-like protein
VPVYAARMTKSVGSPSAPTVRIARHTGAFAEIVAFYRDGVRLPVLGSFDDHDGYAGIIFGLPGSDHQLEFTSTPGATAARSAPSDDDLVVLYFDTREAADEVAARLAPMAERAAPANPYWQTRVESVSFLDPDGWRVVLVYPGATSR